MSVKLLKYLCLFQIFPTGTAPHKRETRGLMTFRRRKNFVTSTRRTSQLTVTFNASKGALSGEEMLYRVFVLTEFLNGDFFPKAPYIFGSVRENPAERKRSSNLWMATNWQKIPTADRTKSGRGIKRRQHFRPGTLSRSWNPHSAFIDHQKIRISYNFELGTIDANFA